MEKVYLIKEVLMYTHSGKIEETIVGAALNEEEAKHKVKHAQDHFVVCESWKYNATVEYRYEELQTSLTHSWLVDEK